MAVVPYRYVFSDLLTGAYITDLPLVGVTFDKRIRQAGALQAAVPIPNEEVAEQVAAVVSRHPDDLTTGAGRTTCTILRDGDAWGEYWITGAKVSRSRRGTIAVALRGSTLDAFPNQVKIADDLGPYTQVEQVQIARNLWTAMQALPGANIGMQLQPGTTPVKRDRTYLKVENVTYGQRLEELSEVLNGFEYTVNITQSAGTRVRTWAWGYPKLGETDTEHVFAEPGNVLEWSEDIDALRGGTRFRARGDSVNTDVTAASSPLTSDWYEASDYLDAGWPRIDRVYDYPQVTELSTLNNYAAYWAATTPGAVRIHQATVRLDTDTTFAPNNLGDLATLKLVNEWWPRADGVASFSKSWRVIGMAVTPVSRQTGQEEARLIFEEALD